LIVISFSKPTDRLSIAGGLGIGITWSLDLFVV